MTTRALSALVAVAAAALGLAAAADDDVRLADAARDRDVATVTAILAEGADVDAFGSDGTPALHWMVRVQDLETAQALLEAGADPNLPNRYGVAPLHLAVANADAAMITLLLDAGAHPDTVDAAQETPLMLAARDGDAEIATLLLDAGAQVDLTDAVFDQTALMVAAREGRTEVAELLIARGADVDAQSRMGPVPEFVLPSQNAGSKGDGIIRGGWPAHGMRPMVAGAKTPLFYAAREGHLEMARLLIDAGANLELADGNETTPLIAAFNNARPDVAMALIEAGADVNASDWYGQTPLWAAVDGRNRELPNEQSRDNGVDRDGMLAAIDALLARGADVNARTKEFRQENYAVLFLGSFAWVDLAGQTPFLRAALAGDVTVMRRLVEHGADPNIATFEGTTPLMAAAGMNWVFNQTYDEGEERLLDAVRLCWELGADVDAVNSMGLGAVHAAANRGSDGIIAFLHEKGARLDVADNEGRTPLTWAGGVFLATHAPFAKPSTQALLAELLDEDDPTTSAGDE